MNKPKKTERCDNCPIRSNGIFKDLSKKAFDSLTCCMEPHRFPAHHVIFLEGNPCRQIGTVRSGRIKLSTSGECGRTQILGAYGSGFVLGCEGLIGRPYLSTAETLTEAELCMASHRDIRRLMKEYPDVALGLARFLCMRIEELERKTLHLGTLSTRQRLAAYLLTMNSDDGRPAPQSVNEPPLTRQEIAETLGMARETLIRLLSKFEQQRMIRLDGSAVYIKDAARLQQVLCATN